MSLERIKNRWSERFHALCCVLAGIAVHAQGSAQALPVSPTDFSPDLRDKNRLAGSQLSWDNDAWVFGHTDRWYTNGTRYSWTYRINEPDSALGRMGAAIGKYALRIDATPTLTYTLGQTMYTPKDITQAAPQPNDRPWAAFLYVGITGSQNDQHGSFSTADLKLGYTGAGAQGELAQSTVHRLIGSPQPAGWAQQLQPRAGLQLSYAKVHLLEQDLQRDRVGLQLGWAGALGTLRNYANINATVVIGDLAGSDGQKRAPPVLLIIP